MDCCEIKYEYTRGIYNNNYYIIFHRPYAMRANVQVTCAHINNAFICEQVYWRHLFDVNSNTDIPQTSSSFCPLFPLMPASSLLA